MTLVGSASMRRMRPATKPGARYLASGGEACQRRAIPDGDKLADGLVRAQRGGGWRAKGRTQIGEHRERCLWSDQTRRQRR